MKTILRLLIGLMAVPLALAQVVEVDSASALVTAAARAQRGQTIRLAADITLTRAVKFLSDGIEFDGGGHTITAPSTAGFNALQFEANGKQLIRIHDATIHGGRIGLHCTNGVFHVENVTGRYAGSHGAFFGGIGDGASVYMTRSTFSENGRSGRGAGLALGDRSRHFAYNCVIEDCEFIGNAAFAGADGETGTGIRICGPQEFISGLPPELQDWKTHDIQVIRCRMIGNGSSGGSVQLGLRVSVMNCVARWNNWNGSRQTTPSGEGYGWRVYGGAGHQIVGGDFSDNLAHGICVENDTRCGLSGSVTATGNVRGPVLVKDKGRLKGDGTLNGAAVDFP